MPSEESQQDPESLGAEVVDLTERRRLELVHERMDAWEAMCFGAAENLVPHPTELGDVEHVSSTGWSHGKRQTRYSYLLKCLAALAERWTEGADREDLLQFALIPLSFVQTLFSLDGEKVDVPEAIEASVDRIAEAMQVTTTAIMDGELTPDEKAQMREALRALEAAAREGRTAVSQTAEQTSLWPSRVHGPRV